MSVEPAAAPRSSAPVPWALIPVTPAVSCALLTAGATGLLPPLIALAAAVAVSTAVHSALLIRLALVIHLRSHSMRFCRGTGLLGASLLVTGGTVAGAVAVQHHDGVPDRTAVLPDPLAAGLCAGGLLAATVLFLLGLLLLPGTASGARARVRRVLDGAAIGTCVLYSGWLMLVDADHDTGSLAVPIALIGCAGLAIAVVTAVRAVRYRPVVLACCTGTILSMIGMAGLAVVFRGEGPSGWLWMAALALVFGPALCWAGALRAADDPPPPVAAGHTEPGFAGYPILVVPVGTALAATGYRLVDGKPFGTAWVALGLGVLIALAAREVFTMLDIRQYARDVAAQEARFRSLLTGSADITLVLDAALVVRWQSPAAIHQFGLSDVDVLDRAFPTLVHPDDAGTVRERLLAVLATRPGAPAAPALLCARLRDGAGHWRDTESTVSDQRTVPEVGALVVHVRDVGERRRVERARDRAAFTDALTGLANRVQLLRTIGAMREVPGQPGALLVIDLYGLSAANPVAGPDPREPVLIEVGDAVLVEVARRLRATVNQSGLPVRLGGTKFAVATAEQPVQAYALASRVLTGLGQPYQLPGATVSADVGIGLAELSGASGAGDALARAELALRRARQLRPGRIEWYDEALEAALLHRVTLEEELPGVVARGELDLVFQPILNLVEGVPVGAEALLRWRHPARGTVLAADFIPVAEDLGLIDEIGEWVLHHACRQLAGWLRDGRELWLSVNLAARQLASPNLVSRVGRALDNHQIPPERLVLEVTEQALGPDLQDAVAQLAGLRALGVRTALAKFGTGPTPLALLRRLPVDVLKVDRTLFAERVGPAATTVEVIVELGRLLGMEIVAEGLEADAHLDLVRAGGCRYGQGFLFGRPEPAEHFEAYLENHRSPTT